MDKTLQLHHKHGNLLTPVDFLSLICGTSCACRRPCCVCSSATLLRVPLSSERTAGTQTRAFTRRDKEAPGETMSDWREQRASLGSGTGETLDSLKPSQTNKRRSFSADSSRRSGGTRNFSCEVFEFPIQASQCSYHSSQGLLPFLVFSRSAPGSSLSLRAVVHTRDVFPPEHAHFSSVVSLL